jgi:hypothetical protein
MIVSIIIKYSFTFINGMDINILGAGYAHASYDNNIISDISTPRLYYLCYDEEG